MPRPTHLAHLAHAHEALSHAPRARTGFDSPAGSSTPATHQQNAPSLPPPTLACHLALFLWIPLLPSLPSPSLHSPIHVQHHTPAARDSTPRPAHPDQQNAPSLLLPLTLACHLPLTLACHLAPTASYYCRSPSLAISRPPLAHRTTPAPLPFQMIPVPSNSCLPFFSSGWFGLV